MPDSGPVFRVLGALSHAPKKSKDGYMARCPAHEDRQASLSIGSGLDGRVLLKCHAGCPAENIVAALGLTMGDLFEKSAAGNPLRRFKVIDQRGKTVAVHAREDLPDKKKIWWENGLNGTSLEALPLYGLPRVLGTTGPVVIVEGEKAADALNDIGVLALGTVTGAASTPSYESLAPLTGREVWLWPDNDDQGRQHMQRVAQRLAEPPRWVEWANAPSKGDAADYVASGGDSEGIRRMLRKPEPSVDEFDGADLAAEMLAEPRWAVRGVLPEGVALLAGKSKLGKSWLALDIALAIAEGSIAWGSIEVEQGEVLYLALEDSKRRLQDRLQKLRGKNVPRGVTFRVVAPRSNEGGIELILDWLNRHARARLVIIDVLGKFRPHEANSRRLYDLDYEAIAPIADVARQRGVCVLVICHCNKLNPEDPVDSVSGTTGLVGAADAICVFRRERGKADASLFIVGRDVEEQDLAFRNTLDSAGPHAWELIGDAGQLRLSEQRKELIEVITSMPGMTAVEVNAAAGKAIGATRYLLFQMTRDGQIRSRDSRYYPAASIKTPPITAITLQPISHSQSQIPRYRAYSADSGIRADSGDSGQRHALCRVCGNELQPELVKFGLHYDCVEESRT